MENRRATNERRPGPDGPVRAGFRHRLGVFSRVVAAILGGYALAALTSVVATLAYSADRDEAIAAAAAPAYVVFAAAVLWCFAAGTAWRAWLGLIGPGALLGVVAIWLRHSIVP